MFSPIDSRFFIPLAAAHRPHPAPERAGATTKGRVVSGPPTQVRQQLTELAATYAVNDLILTSITADFADRRRSCELPAEALDQAPLGSARSPAAAPA